MSMDYSNVIIILTRQRGGIRALCSVLESHPDIFCLDEVFSPPDPDASSDHETNYFTFLKNYTQGDITQLFPGNQENVFLDLVEYLRCFSPKRYLIISINY